MATKRVGKYFERVAVALSVADRERISSAAAERDITISQYGRRAIREALDRDLGAAAAARPRKVHHDRAAAAAT
jgi:hypothetical protein